MILMGEVYIKTKGRHMQLHDVIRICSNTKAPPETEALFLFKQVL